MSNSLKRFLSMALALIMVIGMMPTNFAFATEGVDETSASEPDQLAGDGVIDTEAELAAALAAGGEVVLGGNIDVTAEIQIPAGITANLDLAGYAIKGVATSADRHVYALRNNGVFTITDSVGTGYVSGRGIYNGTDSADNTGVKLTVNGAKIVSEDWNGGAGVWDYGGEVYLNNATIIGNTGVVSAKGYLEINGGTYICYSGINDNGENVGAPTYNVRAYDGLKITGGTFTSRHGVVYFGGTTGLIENGSFVIKMNSATPLTSNVVYTTEDTGTLTINDGEFRMEDLSDADISGTAVQNNGTSVVINNGTFVGLNGMVDGNTTVNGGSFDTVFDYNHYGNIESKVAEGAVVTVAGTIYTKTENGLEEITPPVESTVVTVADQAAAQAALDNVVPGTTIVLTENVNYGVLYLRPSPVNPATKVVDWQGNNYRYETYSCFENLTIRGASGATIDAIVIEGGTYFNTEHSQAATYPIMLSLIELKNVVIDGVTFTGKGGYDPQGHGNVLNFAGNNIKVNGLTVQNCVLNDSEDNARLLYKTESTTTVHNYTYDGASYTFVPDLSNITVTGCTFNGGYMGLELRETNNLTISGNTFNGVAGRDILLPANTGCTYSGTVAVSGNTSNGAGNRFLRADGIGDAKLVVENNKIENYQGADADFIKVSVATGEKSISGNTFNGTAVDFVVKDGAILVNKPVAYAAMIGDKGYETLAAAIAAVQEGETITVLAGTISEGTIKLPATLKNVTFKGAEGAILKDMKIMAADGNSFSYEGLTFDGLTFDNSRILFTGWRNGDEIIKNLTVTNCTFKNLDDSTNEACVHINKDVSEPVDGFTFTNNVIDGATGGAKSGIYSANTGKVTITGNIFNNIVFRPALVAMADCDGIADDVVVSDNKISNTTRLQIYGSEADNGDGTWTPVGTDTLKIAINDNIFQNISGYYICTWGLNGEADISENYYDGSISEKIYWNNQKPADEKGLAELNVGVHPYYTELNTDGTINTESAVEAPYLGLKGAGTEANPYLVSDLRDLKFFRDSVNAGNNYSGKYVKVTATEIDLANEEWEPIGYMGKNFVGNFDGNGATIKNLKITKTLTNSAANNGIGFFGRTDDPAVIKNFTVENVDITGSLYVGAVVGYGYTGKMVQNVTVKGDIAIDAWWYAGVIGGNGYMNLVDDCHVIGNEGSYIKGNNGSYIGGIWGFRGEGNNKITNCTVEGLDISGVDRVGGIAGIGHYGNTVSGCEAENVTVTATDPEATTVGLIVGATQGTASEPTNFENNTTTNTIAQKDNGDGSFTPVTNEYGTNIDGTVPTTNYVAKIGNKEYASLQAAVEAVAEGETIVLTKDIIFTTGANGSTNGISYVRGASFTLDLNGKTVTSNLGNNALRFKIGDGNDVKNTNVTITIKNGKLVSGSNNWCAISAATADNSGNKLTLNLEDMRIEASKAGDYAVKSWAGAVVNAKDVEVTASYAGGFYAVGGEIVLDDCAVNQTGTHTAPYMSMAVAVSGNGKLTVNSGTYTAVPAAASDAYNQGTSHGSWAAGVMSSGGTLVINGGTFTNGNVGEDSLATAARALLCIDAGGKLEVNGGTFNALKNVIYLINNIGDAALNPTATVTGGTFSNDPTVIDGYGVAVIPEGYAVVENADGTYTIIKVLKGEGTAEAPYTIDSLEDLILFRDSVNAGEAKYNAKNVYVKLTTDIDLAAVATRAIANWEPIGTVTTPYKGHFDGGENTISNMVVSGGNYVGLFGKTTDGSIKNVKIENVTAQGVQYVGAIAGMGYTGSIENCHVSGSINITGNYMVGGINGHGYASITDCSVIGNDKAVDKIVATHDGASNEGDNVGGIVGHNGENNHITGCDVENVTISGTRKVAGIVGITSMHSKVTDCSIKNVIVETTATADYAEDNKKTMSIGGIVGQYQNGSGGAIADCVVDGLSFSNVNNVEVSAGTLTGGLRGTSVVLAPTTDIDVSGTTVGNVEGATNEFLFAAKVNDVLYTTLQAAIDAAQAGETVTLICDVEQKDGVLVTDKNITIDLNGKTFTVSEGANTNNRNFKINGTSVVTIENGTMIAKGDYSSGAYGTVRTEGAANVTLENLKLYNYRGNGLNVKALGGTTVTMTDVEVYSEYGGGIESAGGTIELNNVTVDQKGMYTAPYNSMAISVNGGGKVTVNSGIYTTECLTAEEAYNQGTSHGSWAVGVLNSGGTLIINGGTFANGNYGDDALATAARGLILADTGAVVEINGGTFNALKGIVDIQNNLGNASKNPTGTITGGIFSADPTNGYVKVYEDFKAVDLGNGYYGIQQATGIATIKRGNVKLRFDTLEAAIEAANDGETIVLDNNCYTSEVDVDKDITIDLADCTLYLTAGGNNIFGNVSIENGTIDISGVAAKGDCIIGVGDYSNNGKLTLNDVNMVGDGYSSAFAVMYVYNESELNINGGTYELSNDKASAGGFIKAEQGKDGIVNITDAVINLTDAKIGFLDGTVSMDGVELTIKGGANAINQSALTVKDSTITVDGADGRALTLSQGDVTIINSDLSFSNCSEGEIRFKKGLTLNVDENSTIAECDIWSDVSSGAKVNDTEVTGTEKIPATIENATVTNPDWAAKTGDTYYVTINEAMSAAKAGDTVYIFAGQYTQDLNVNKDITVIGETTETGYQLAEIYGKLNITADGATVKGLYVYNADNAAYIGAKDVLIEGCEIASGASAFRSCYTSGDVTFKDSVIVGSIYGIHFDGNAGGNIVIDNCKITGWTSFAATIGNVAIEDTSFEQGNYNQLRLYQNAQLTNVTFNPDMTVDFGTDDVDADFTGCSVSDGSDLLDVIYLPDLAEMGVDVTVDTVPVIVVALIGEEAYFSIDEALAAAQDGDTITLYVDDTIETAYDIRDMKLTIDGTATLNTADKLNVYGETTLNISAPVSGDVNLCEGAIVTSSSVNGAGYVAGNVTFRGDNTFTMLTDYGDYYSSTTPSKWTVEKDASLTLTKADRYGLGYGDEVTIYGNIDNALTARGGLTDADADVNMYGGLVGMTNSAAPNAQNKLTVEDAYVIFGVKGDKSFGNKSGNYYGNYTFNFDNSVITANAFKFYEDKGKSVVNITGSDLLVNGVFMTNDTNSEFNFTDSVILSKATSNGTDDKNQNAGAMTLDNTDLTYSALFTNVGTINMDMDSSITAPAVAGNGKIIIDATGYVGEDVVVIKGDMTGYTGDIEVTGALYTVDANGLTITMAEAKIGTEYYATLEAAIEAAQAGDEIILLADVELTKELKVNDKNFTIDGAGNSITGTGRLWLLSGTYAIENVVFENNASSGFGVLEFTHANASVTGCTFQNNTAASCIAVDTNANNDGTSVVTVDGCTFTGNTCSTAVINSAEGTTTVKDSAITANAAGVAVIYNSASCNITGNYFAGNTLTGTNANKATILTGPWVDGTYNVNINGNAFTDAGVAVYVENWKPVTNNIDDNYWYDGDQPVAGTDFIVDKGAEANPNSYNTAYTYADGVLTLSGETEIDYVAQIGGVKYETVADAIAAAEAGETVKLLTDVALTESLTVVKGATVTLDLNGKTITGTDNSEKSFGLINTNGNLTIKDSVGGGKITLVATNNRGWNAYSSVISNNPGGKLTVESGTIEHLGGTDMAYGIDNLTNGKGTYAETVINGGTVKSPYRAIRQFLNGIEAQNILTVNGGTIEGANKSIWMQDPSANANTGTLTVGENATLKGDVYLSVTAGSTEWPVEVSIAAAALADGSKVLEGNVPAGYDVANVGGTYGVYTGAAKIGTTYYETLQAAVDAAGEDAVIDLLSDGTATVSKAMTINKNGQTATLYVKNTLSVVETEEAYEITDAPVVTTGEAAIGATVYKTLKEAIEAATEGQFINILTNIDTAPAVTIDKNLTIIANGCTLWASDLKTAIEAITADTYEVSTIGPIAFVTAKPAAADPVATINGTEYATVQAALAAAKSGDTVVMIANSDEADVDLYVRGGITLDLAGKQLTAAGLTTAREANVIDSSARPTSLLVVPQGSLALRADNAQLPIWNEENAYFFMTPKTPSSNQKLSEQTDSSFKVTFRPDMGYAPNGSVVRYSMFGNGAADNEITLKARVSWTRSDGTLASQDFTYPESLVPAGFSQGQGFTLTMSGLTDIQSMDFQVVLVSDTGAEFVGTALTYTK